MSITWIHLIGGPYWTSKSNCMWWAGNITCLSANTLPFTLSLTLSLSGLPYHYCHTGGPLWPLIMWQIHGSDAGVAAWVDVELFEVTSLPHLHHTVVPACHQVVAVTAQEDRLQEGQGSTCHLRLNFCWDFPGKFSCFSVWKMSRNEKWLCTQIEDSTFVIAEELNKNNLQQWQSFEIKV